MAITRKWSGWSKSRTARQSVICSPFAEVQQVDHRPAAGVAGQLRQVVDLPPIDLALVGEEQQVGVGAGDEEVLDRVFLFGLGPGQPLAAAALRAIDRSRRPLDVAVAADGDDHRLLGR